MNLPTENVPYISFISFARNDDYVAQRAERHNLSLNFLLQQLKDYKIPSEILLVEWNYPTDRPPLAETLKITIFTPWTVLRVIRVPPMYHQKYRFWQLRPFHVGAAINVGTRRAAGKFILPIASDVFLTDSCLETIAKQDLDERTFYRADRYDVNPIVLESLKSTFPFDRHQFFKACQDNVKTHHKRIMQEPSFQIANLHTNGAGDFYLTHHSNLHRIRGSKEGSDTGALDIDSLVLHALYGLGIEQKIFPDSCRVYKIFHHKSTSRALETVWKPWQIGFEKNLMIRRLVSTKKLNDLRILFNYPKRKYSYAPEAIFDSFEKNFVKPARQWAKKKPPFYLNGNDWGLGNISLEEIKIL